MAYDNNIFEYVRSEGGTENDNGTRVRVTYYDSAGGTNPRTNMSVTFKAKEEGSIYQEKDNYFNFTHPNSLLLFDENYKQFTGFKI